MRDKGEPSSPPKPITIDDALAAKYSGPDQFERSMRRLDP